MRCQTLPSTTRCSAQAAATGPASRCFPRGAPRGCEHQSASRGQGPRGPAGDYLLRPLLPVPASPRHRGCFREGVVGQLTDNTVRGSM